MDIVKQISQIVEEEREFSNDEIINILNAVGKHGDVIILKNDGLRPDNNYTVVIGSANSTFESIRYDTNDLSEGLKKALKDYLKTVK